MISFPIFGGGVGCLVFLRANPEVLFINPELFMVRNFSLPHSLLEHHRCRQNILRPHPRQEESTVCEESGLPSA